MKHRSDILQACAQHGSTEHKFSFRQIHCTRSARCGMRDFARIPNIRQADRETVSQQCYHVFATLRKELAFSALGDGENHRRGFHWRIGGLEQEHRQQNPRLSFNAESFHRYL